MMSFVISSCSSLGMFLIRVIREICGETLQTIIFQLGATVTGLCIKMVRSPRFEASGIP
jgi:hypothetical protein